MSKKETDIKETGGERGLTESTSVDLAVPILVARACPRDSSLEQFGGAEVQRGQAAFSIEQLVAIAAIASVAFGLVHRAVGAADDFLR